MKQILVPVDFSETSLNAARYALKFARKVGGCVSLLHAFMPPPVFPQYDGLLMSEAGMREMQERNLKELAEKLHKEDIMIKVDAFVMDGQLSQAVRQFRSLKEVFMIVMGITGAGKLKQTLIGSNTLDVAKHTQTPVLIIPEHAVYDDITDIGLATDFREVAETIPENNIRWVLDATGARLHVLNVDFEHAHANADTPFQSGLVETMFQRYAPRYHFIDHPDIAEALDQYAEKLSIEMLIVVPKKHHFIDRLFRGSATQKLVFHSRIPVLVMCDVA